MTPGLRQVYSQTAAFQSAIVCVYINCIGITFLFHGCTSGCVKKVAATALFCLGKKVSKGFEPAHTN